jgi:hypothetical protein
MKRGEEWKEDGGLKEKENELQMQYLRSTYT